MVKQIYYFCILFYVSILVVLIVGCFGGFEGLYATAKTPPKVIETFKAGPLEGTKKTVVKVKTHYDWTLENPCPCQDDDPPCIKTFLNKDQPSEETETFRVFNQMNNNSDKYEGGYIVPALIQQSSVRILTVPFCKQKKAQE